MSCQGCNPGCPVKLAGECVVYSGGFISGPSITNGDNFNVVVQKLKNFGGSSTAGFTTSLPLIYNTSSKVLSINQANGTQGGYLSFQDWNDFKNKVPSTRAINTNLPLSGGGSLAGDLTITLPKSSSLVDGYLSSNDWSYFNNKENVITFQQGVTRTVNTVRWDGVTARLNSADIATRRKLNFIQGSNITLTINDDGINDSINITINSSAGTGSVSWDSVTGKPSTNLIAWRVGVAGFPLDGDNSINDLRLANIPVSSILMLRNGQPQFPFNPGDGDTYYSKASTASSILNFSVALTAGEKIMIYILPL